MPTPFYVVEETASQITRFLPNGTKVSSQPVLIRTDPKHALEGITVDPDGHLVVLNEKTPTALVEFSGTTEVRRFTLSETSDHLRYLLRCRHRCMVDHQR